MSNLVDHVKGALKHSIEDLWNLGCYMTAELVDDGCHGAEHLWFPGGWNVPLVVNENCLQQRWNKVLSHLRTQSNGQDSNTLLPNLYYLAEPALGSAELTI